MGIPQQQHAYGNKAYNEQVARHAALEGQHHQEVSEFASAKNAPESFRPLSAAQPMNQYTGNGQAIDYNGAHNLTSSQLRFEPTIVPAPTSIITLSPSVPPSQLHRETLEAVHRLLSTASWKATTRVEAINRRQNALAWLLRTAEHATSSGTLQSQLFRAKVMLRWLLVVSE